MNLDAIPFPDFSLNRAKPGKIAGKFIVPVQTSRGCPFQCAYCEGGVSRGERLASHSLARVFAEIRWLQDNYDISRFRLLDDTFTVQRTRAIEFCRRYRDSGFTFGWGALSRVDGLEPDLMEGMAQARCDTIYIGVESGSDRVLKAIRKRVTSDRVAAVVNEEMILYSEVFERAAPEIAAHLAPDRLARVFDLGHHLRYVDALFARAWATEER